MSKAAGARALKTKYVFKQSSCPGTSYCEEYKLYDESNDNPSSGYHYFNHYVFCCTPGHYANTFNLQNGKFS